MRQDVRCPAFNPEPQMVLNKEYMAPEHQLYWEEVGGAEQGCLSTAPASTAAGALMLTELLILSGGCSNGCS